MRILLTFVVFFFLFFSWFAFSCVRHGNVLVCCCIAPPSSSQAIPISLLYPYWHCRAYNPVSRPFLLPFLNKHAYLKVYSIAAASCPEVPRTSTPAAQVRPLVSEYLAVNNVALVRPIVVHVPIVLV